MNRRSALKAITVAGLGALLPSWLITPAKRRIDLAAWCSLSEGRAHDMRQPFAQSSWTYATDGSACVRVAPLSGDQLGAEVRLPPADALPYWDHDRLRGWQSWPKHPVIHEAQGLCLECRGSGWLGELIECENCFGLGQLIDSSGGGYHFPGTDVWVTCERCQGAGYSGGTGGQCSVCHGKGEGRFPSVVELAPGYFVAADYHRRVLGIGGAELALPSNPDPVRFRFEEGVGLLCPLDPGMTRERMAQ